MAGYKPPKKRLHREFLYLNHETILNSLSAMEAGKVDEIIQKAVEAREGGLEANLAAGPVRGGGGKRKKASIEEELVKTRTWFSAFEAWREYLEAEEAVGTFDEWDMDVRNALSVGDTLEFSARLVISPVHKLFRTYISYAENAARPGHLFSQKGAELAETKKGARQMTEWLGGRDKPTNLAMYFQPSGVAEPRIVGSLQDKYLLASHDTVEGTFTVVGQVAGLLSEGQSESSLRLIRDVPPTQVELEAIEEAISLFIEPAKTIGVDLTPEDISIGPPAVLLRPIAVYQ